MRSDSASAKPILSMNTKSSDFMLGIGAIFGITILCGVSIGINAVIITYLCFVFGFVALWMLSMRATKGVAILFFLILVFSFLGMLTGIAFALIILLNFNQRRRIASQFKTDSHEQLR